MKINFLLPKVKITGGVRAILTYANLLTSRGHEVRVIVKSRRITRYIFNILNIKPVWFKKLKAKVIRVPEFSSKFIPDADILVADTYKIAGASFNLSKTKGVKFQTIQHDERLYHGLPEKVSDVYNLSLKKIVISSWLKGIIKEQFNSDAELIVTPVDFEQFNFVEGVRREKPIRVIMLHHAYVWKGIKIGKEAFDMVKKEFPDIQLILFGARQKKIDIKCDEYFYNPKQEDMAKMFSSCHIFLCPSEYEGLGMPAMEAMACKCAVVTFDTGGSRDYAFDGRTAMVANQGNINELAEKLKMLVVDKKLRQQIAKNGYNFIRENFLWEAAVEKMEKIFKNSLEKNA